MNAQKKILEIMSKPQSDMTVRPPHWSRTCRRPSKFHIVAGELYGNMENGLMEIETIKALQGLERDGKISVEVRGEADPVTWWVIK